VIRLRLNSQKLEKILQKSTTYANEIAGKIVENALRNCITGEGSDGLSVSNGLYQQAEGFAPSKGEIDNSVRKLKSAFVFVNGRKLKSRLSPKLTEDLIVARAKTIGHTSRTLAYSAWSEAKKSRGASIPSDLPTSHTVLINTKGEVPTAKFKSKHRGLSHMMKEHNITSSAVNEIRGKLADYAKNILTKDMKEIFK
jgi:hypothetical protein